MHLLCLSTCLAHSALLSLSLGLPKVAIISVLPDCFPVPHPHMHLSHHKQLLSWPPAHTVTQLLQLLIPDRYSFSPCFFSGKQMFVLVLQSCLSWFCIGVIDRTGLVQLPVGVQCWSCTFWEVEWLFTGLCFAAGMTNT